MKLPKIVAEKPQQIPVEDSIKFTQTNYSLFGSEKT